MKLNSAKATAVETPLALATWQCGNNGAPSKAKTCPVAAASGVVAATRLQNRLKPRFVFFFLYFFLGIL